MQGVQIKQFTKLHRKRSFFNIKILITSSLVKFNCFQLPFLENHVSVRQIKSIKEFFSQSTLLDKCSFRWKTTEASLLSIMDSCALSIYLVLKIGCTWVFNDELCALAVEKMLAIMPWW